MSAPSEEPLRIPSLEELQSVVVPRRLLAVPTAASSKGATKLEASPDDVAREDIELSTEAASFLRHAAERHHRSMTLEERWKALGISSGSKKESILNELRTGGLIHLERKGRSYQVHLYERSYRYLGIPKIKGEGVGGTTHNLAVKRIAALFKNYGYEVHIEQEVGARRKSVDVMAYGNERILAIEVGLSDLNQEIKNLTEDLQSGVPHLVLFVSTDRKIIEAVRTRAKKDVYLSEQMNRIKFFYLEDI